MGYKRGALVLEWPEDSEFSGLEIRMRRLSIAQLLRIEGLSDLRKSSDSAEVAQAFDALLDALGEGLLSWNYEDDDGTPVPAERASLTRLDLDLVLAWVKGWTKAAAGIPLASPPSSPTGEPVPPDEEWASFLASSQEVSPEPVSS